MNVDEALRWVDGWGVPTLDSTYCGHAAHSLAAEVRHLRAELAKAEAERDAAREDAERFDWVLPVITGEDEAETNKRTFAIGMALTSGLSGRAAIDSARTKT